MWQGAVRLGSVYAAMCHASGCCVWQWAPCWVFSGCEGRSVIMVSDYEGGFKVSKLAIKIEKKILEYNVYSSPFAFVWSRFVAKCWKK